MTWIYNVSSEICESNFCQKKSQRRFRNVLFHDIVKDESAATKSDSSKADRYYIFIQYKLIISASEKSHFCVLSPCLLVSHTYEAGMAFDVQNFVYKLKVSFVPKKN